MYQLVDMYKSNLKKLNFSHKKLVGNSQLFNKRVNMFNNGREKRHLERINNVSRSLRGVKHIKSLKDISIDNSSK